MASNFPADSSASFNQIGNRSLSGSAWKEPRCFIESTADDKLKVNAETLSLIQEITDPVVVVAIVGLYRTGKSYLMNRLAGQSHGFALGSAVQARTKGIWVWALPHPMRENCSLVLLDTEGLGDVEKGNANHDTWIFALTVLLSSTMVYNSIGTIDQNSIDKLHFVTEMAEHIKIKTRQSGDESWEFNKFFPSFIWTVRDFTLDLEIDERAVTEDEYLEHALQLKRGAGRKVTEYNLPRECLRTYFPQRKCFIFPRPVQDQRLLRNLETVSDSQLQPEFLEKTKTFLQYVLESSRVKSISGNEINGRLLGGLGNCYVDAIRNGVVPCIESAVDTTAKLENERAIKESLDLYQQKFRERVKFPTETMLELSNCHHLCEKEAAEYFIRLSIFDYEKIYYKKMMDELKTAYQMFVNENEEASQQVCQSLLRSLHKPIGDDLEAGKYAQPGGYGDYSKNMDALLQKYKQTPGLGVASGEVLHEFMKQQEATTATVLKADEKLAEGAKKVEAERQKADASEREKQAAQEEERKTQQLMVDQKKSFDEHVRRVEKEAGEDRKKMQEELERVLESKLKEQEKLLREGFDQKVNTMNAEITDLKKAIEESHTQSGPDQSGLAMGFLSSIFSAVPNMITALKAPKPGCELPGGLGGLNPPNRGGQPPQGCRMNPPSCGFQPPSSCL